MKKKVVSLILGLLFTIGLVLSGYLNLIFAIAFSLSKSNDWYVYVAYLFWIIAFINLIMSILVFKIPKLTAITQIISCGLLLSSIIYLVINNMFDFKFILIMLIIMIVGIISAILAIKSRKNGISDFNEIKSN